MTKGDLDGVTFLGRPIKPVALAELDAAIRDAEAAARDNADNL